MFWRKLLTPFRYIRAHQPQNSGWLAVALYYLCISAVAFGVGWLVVGLLSCL